MKNTPITDDNDWHDDPMYWLEDEKCPDCGSKHLVSCYRANGPDDYVTQTECMGCGTTWEN